MSNHLKICLLFFATLISVIRVSFSDASHGDNRAKLKSPKFNDNALFLTPYIETGRIAEAQQLATVAPMLKSVESFAGYLTVNKTCNSNLFFWLFKSQRGNWRKQPLIVWLEGGAAQTSLYGLFRAVGPFFVPKNHKLTRRRYSWNRESNLVFIDNPVGAGFSFTKINSGYSENVFDAARNLYEALVQLYKLFPALTKTKLVIAGESVGAKYAVAVAHKIYKMNRVCKELKLDRLILASAFVDPFFTGDYSSYLYKLGLVDGTRQQKYFQQEETIRAYIKAGDFAAAFKAYNAEEQAIKNLTGLKSVVDFVHDDIGKELKAGAIWFLNQTTTKTALHLGDHKLDDGKKAIVHMAGDFMRSVKPLVEELLKAEMFPILFLNGQLDIDAAYSLNLEFFNALEWPHAKEYYAAKRCQFRVRKQVAAYYKTAGTFTEMLVRNTGHLIAASKPRWIFELVKEFIKNGTSFQCA